MKTATNKRNLIGMLTNEFSRIGKVKSLDQLNILKHKSLQQKYYLYQIETLSNNISNTK